MVIGTPFVGRRREVDLLRGKLFAPGLGTAQFVRRTGGPGVGETRPLAEFAAPARDGGVTMVSGRAGEYERHVAFGVLSDDGLSTMDTEDGQDAIDVERDRANRARHLVRHPPRARYDATGGDPLCLEALARHPDADGSTALAAELATLSHIDLQVARRPLPVGPTEAHALALGEPNGLSDPDSARALSLLPHA
ncbi:hypothetical protein [Kutzneria sp. CA-103260]|uniref:hypothetical protein n=1 Tax=Kutzneria sp. CA-103260 TaxID=2802641 RepID=UPI001BA75AE7|nr:hypothetical protein [Kutzneria sp. CA-103260]QUQ62305.1 hypothetical protein JJ691_00170 [Kutzneria sp. CA-103260]